MERRIGGWRDGCMQGTREKERDVGKEVGTEGQTNR